MRARWLLNLGLLVAVCLLGWLALTKSNDAPPAFTPLSTVDPLSITRLRIENENQPNIELEKVGAQWHMRTPYQTLANNMHINKLLSLLETPSYTQFSVDRELGQYGLDKPRVHMIMNDTLRISFGSTEPVGKRRYVRVNEQVHVVADSPFAQLTAAASLLVDTALFAKDTVIRAIALPTVTLQQQADGSWQLSTAGNYSADAVNAYVDEWRHARAVFVSDPGKSAASDETISITLAEDRIVQFGIVKLNTGLTLVNQETGLHYHFAADVGEQLLSPPTPDA